MPSDYADLDAYTADTAKPPEKGQRFIRDNKLSGFALRITSTGAKSWIVEAAVRGQKNAKRRTIGRYPAVKADRARKLAIQELGRFAEGKDTLAEERTERAVSLSLGDVFTDYLANRDLKPRTVEDYKKAFSASFEDWREKRITSITRSMVEARHKRETENRGPAHANLAMRILRALFNYAIGRYEDGDGNPVVTDNPVSRLSAVRAWNRVERRRRHIRPHELPAWFDAVDKLRQKDPKKSPASATVADWLEFVLLTGCRKTEALTLRWADVDLEGKLLRLPDTKNREIHELPLSCRLAEMLERRNAARTDRRESDLVFAGGGEGGRLGDVRRGILYVTEQSGIPFAPHDLRRTFATTAERLDLPTYTIKRLMNHTIPSGDVTGGYIQIDVERLRIPVQRISEAILIAAGRGAGAASSEVLALPVRGSTAAR